MLRSIVNEVDATQVDGKQPDGRVLMPDLTTYKLWIEDYLNATESTRQRAGIRRDYYDGIQWTETEAQDLRNRGQPVLVYNYIQEKVGTLVGAEVAGRTAPKATGRNAGVDQATAAVATAGMRYVTDEADWDGERTMGREQLVIEGVVGTEIIVDPKAILKQTRHRLFRGALSRMREKKGSMSGS